MVLLDDVEFAAALECSSSQVVPAKKSVKKSSGGCNADENFFRLFIEVRDRIKQSVCFVCVVVPSGSTAGSEARATLIVCPLSVLSNWLVSV